MKTTRILLTTLAATACSLGTAHATLLAFWDFNNGFDAGSGAVQIAHPASIGSGTLYQQRAEIDGNGKGGIAYTDPSNGIDAAAGRSMAWDDVGKSGENDAEFFIEFSTTGFKEITIRFDVQGNADHGITSFDLKYDTNPLVDVTDPPDVTGTIKDFAGGLSTSILNNEPFTPGINAAYVEQVVDLTAITGLDNQSTLVLRFDDIKDNDDMRLDNLRITGVPVPEPTSALLASLSLLGVFLRRKRH